MKTFGRAPALFAIFALSAIVFLAGCDSALDEASAPSVAAPAAALGAEVVFPGYTVEFIEARENGDGTTTFEYRVTGTAPGPPSLDWFFLENACDGPALSLVPSNAVGTATVSGIDGYRWQASLPAGQTRIYSYTFPSEAELGAVRTVISRGGVAHGPASLPGPCGEVETVTISGSVFIDSEGDGQKSATDLGIGNVLVQITEGGSVVESGPTAGNGGFSFEVPAGGNYTIAIPADAGGLNAALANSYDATGPLQAPHHLGVVNEDSPNNHFGYIIDPDAIIADLTTTNQTAALPASWWRMAMHHTNAGRCYQGLCPDSAKVLLEQIFHVDGDGDDDFFGLEDPYQLNGMSMTEKAKEILWPQFPTEGLDIVFRNLFAMQLNFFADLGGPDKDYDVALMYYLEQWISDQTNGSARPATGPRTGTDRRTAITIIGDASQMTESGRTISGVIGITEAWLLGGGGGGGAD